MVWIGLGLGLDRPRIGPTFLSMLQRGCIVTRKGRQGGPVLTTVSVWQFDSLAAWMCNSCSLAAGLLDSLVARQLGCLTAWPYNSCSLTAWLYNSLLLGSLAG